MTDLSRSPPSGRPSDLSLTQWHKDYSPVAKAEKQKEKQGRGGGEMCKLESSTYPNKFWENRNSRDCISLLSVGISLKYIYTNPTLAPQDIKLGACLHLKTEYGLLRKDFHFSFLCWFKIQ